MEFLRHFYTPDSEKFTNWSKTKLATYTGHLMHHIVRLTVSCFETFLQKPSVDVDKKYLLFSLMDARDPIVKTELSSYSDAVTETLHKINMALLNSLQMNVMLINLDTFLDWVEVDIDEEYTLQRIVGETTYKLIQLIEVNEVFKQT